MAQKQTLQELVKDITPATAIINKYLTYAPNFIESASVGLKWDKDDEIFKQFLLESDHCAGTIGQGDFERQEFVKLKENWEQISILLAQIAKDQENPDYALYISLSKLIRNCTRNWKRAATRRMISSLQPGLFLPWYSDNRFNSLYRYISQNIEHGDSLSKSGDWFHKSHELLQFFEREIDIDSLDFTGLQDSDLPENILRAIKLRTMPWQILKKIDELKLVSKTNQEDNVMVEGIADILIKHKHQVILQGPPGTGKTYTAKDVAEQLICGEVSVNKDDQQKNLEETGQFELIQFHPSYSYEDFVQGISVNIEEGQPQYTVERRILMKFAEKAYQNYIDSHKSQLELDKEEQFTKSFQLFIEQLITQLEETDESILFEKSKRFIYKIDEYDEGLLGSFYIDGPDTKMGSKIKFADIKTVYLDGNTTRQEIKQNKNISRTAFWYATYVERILTMFRESRFISEHKQTSKKTELKNYVLIIDEINRANLATVLGELIYALEYRGKPVKTLYSRADDVSQNQIILPTNLYIIGTMNTADRSVGSMDYAIRRRFSFINMLPQYLESEENFDQELFEHVSSLFINNLEDYKSNNNVELERSVHLSEEFRPEGIWIGHSYFIGDENNVGHRVKYEIIPLIEEYIKDGILKESAREILLTLKNWQY